MSLTRLTRVALTATLLFAPACLSWRGSYEGRVLERWANHQNIELTALFVSPSSGGTY